MFIYLNLMMFKVWYKRKLHVSFIATPLEMKIIYDFVSWKGFFARKSNLSLTFIGLIKDFSPSSITFHVKKEVVIKKFNDKRRRWRSCTHAHTCCFRFSLSIYLKFPWMMLMMNMLRWLWWWWWYTHFISWVEKWVRGA